MYSCLCNGIWWDGVGLDFELFPGTQASRKFSHKPTKHTISVQDKENTSLLQHIKKNTHAYKKCSNFKAGGTPNKYINVPTQQL
jgi:hypothetical protein